jgi:hypothetical protein
MINKQDGLVGSSRMSWGSQKCGNSWGVCILVNSPASCSGTSAIPMVTPFRPWLLYKANLPINVISHHVKSSLCVVYTDIHGIIRTCFKHTYCTHIRASFIGVVGWGCFHLIEYCPRLNYKTIIYTALSVYWECLLPHHLGNLEVKACTVHECLHALASTVVTHALAQNTIRTRD